MLSLLILGARRRYRTLQCFVEMIGDGTTELERACSMSGCSCGADIKRPDSRTFADNLQASESEMRDFILAEKMGRHMHVRERNASPKIHTATMLGGPVRATLTLQRYVLVVHADIELACSKHDS